MRYTFSVILLICVCSLYYFPVSFKALPSVNSKMVVAALGLCFFVWNHVKRNSISIRRDMVPVLTMGILFSLSSYFSVIYNSTNDMVFATYFVSMAVWLGGAYCVVSLLRLVYGEVSLCTIFLYLGMMCASQCLIAVLIDNMPWFANFVNNTFVGVNPEYFERTSRLYGIGASFDTAGIRFSCVLLGLAYILKAKASQSMRLFSLLLFLIIGVVGNMISRTTAVGVIVSFIYLCLSNVSLRRVNVIITAKGLSSALGLCAMFVILSYVGIYMYNNIPGVHSAFDYGFEGFINMFETGKFSTHSSDLLVNSIGDILPDNTKTWMVGDGYFADPNNPEKFYMGTDMGYIRFFFYCGVMGFAFLLLYFLVCTYILCKRWSNLALFFVLLFVLQLVVWVKIPTDIFCFYALALLSDNQNTFIKKYDSQENTLLLAQ